MGASMYHYLAKAIVISTLLQLGLNFKDVLANPEYAKRKVLKINWKPVSIFPEEARRFR